MCRKQWLSQQLGCEAADIEKLYSSKTALEFLMIWSIFETKCFRKFVRKENIERYANDIASEEVVDLLKNEFDYFFNRYQKKTHYRKLKHGDTYALADAVLCKEHGNVTNCEKIAFLIYVVYRYRNNMFHGNKKLDAWLQYKQQIDCCVDVMIKIIDNNREMNFESA